MATQLFLLNTAASTHLATNNTRLDGTGTGWLPLALALTRGSGVVASPASDTVAGATLGVDLFGLNTTGNPRSEWLSEPVAADVTISGTITANIWAAENSMSANVAINVVIEIVRANDLTGVGSSNKLVQIVKSTRITEENLTTRLAANFTTGMTSGAYTAQTLNRGDRLRIRVFGDDAGTMASGFTFNIGYNGTTAAVDGDSYVTFTEDITFEGAPSGSVLYLTDTASAVSTASVDREAWTSRGSGVVNDVTNTAAGWTAPIQVTDTAGGTVVDWFTRQLQAVTLGGMAVGNIRLAQSTVSPSGGRLEIARVAADGTSPTVWGSWAFLLSNSTTAEVARPVNVSGDDLAISDGERLRIRLYLDDEAQEAMSASQTVTLYYAGTSGGASGDTYVTFPVTLTEYSAAAPGPASSRRQRRASRFLTLRSGR